MTYRLTWTTIAATLSLLAACSGGVETAATGTTGHGGGAGHGGTGTGGAGNGGAGNGGAGGGLPSCSISSYDPTTLELFACDLPAPCPVPHYYEGGSGSGAAPGMPAFADPAAATCVLQKLRDRELVQLQYEKTPADDFIGQYTYTETIFILDPEHGAANAIQWQDLSAYYTRKNHQALQPVAFFDACLAETDAAKIYACLEGWSAGCAFVDAVCPLN
jgi:hypothetical protein